MPAIVNGGTTIRWSPDATYCSSFTSTHGVGGMSCVTPLAEVLLGYILTPTQYHSRGLVDAHGLFVPYPPLPSACRPGATLFSCRGNDQHLIPGMVVQKE